MNLSLDRLETRSVPVTIIAKAKITPLWEGVKRYGSQKALAEALGITPQTLGNLLNCKLKVPPLRKRKKGLMSSPEWDGVFVRVIGCLPEDIWPDALTRDMMDALSEPKEHVSSVHISQLADVGLMQTRLLESPDANSIRREAKECMDVALATLGQNEREVIRTRCGVYGGQSTLAEASMRIGVTVERARQIEARALSKLRHPSRRAMINDISVINDISECNAY